VELGKKWLNENKSLFSTTASGKHKLFEIHNRKIVLHLFPSPCVYFEVIRFVRYIENDLSNAFVIHQILSVYLYTLSLVDTFRMRKIKKKIGKFKKRI